MSRHIDSETEMDSLALAGTLASLRNLVIDMDGVLYRGDEAISGSADLIGFM